MIQFATASTNPKKAIRKNLANLQPKRWTGFQEFDFERARCLHRLATMSIDFALFNGESSIEWRRSNLADYFKYKAKLKACLLKIQANRLYYQTGGKRARWQPIGGDSRFAARSGQNSSN